MVNPNREMSPGNVAYLAYCMHVHSKSVHGEDLPMWHEVTPRIKDAWENAAIAVIEYNHTGRVTLVRGPEY
jgi:hypothetical protein